jgi:hypothetical protein
MIVKSNKQRKGSVSQRYGRTPQDQSPRTCKEAYTVCRYLTMNHESSVAPDPYLVLMDPDPSIIKQKK